MLGGLGFRVQGIGSRVRGFGASGFNEWIRGRRFGLFWF